VREGKSRFLENRQVENFQGIAQGISQVLSGGFRSVSGIMFATTLVASLAKAGSVAIKTFAMVGEGAFAISSAFGALLSSIEIYQLVTAKKKIEKAGDKNAITMIQEEMEDPKLAATWKSVLGESLFERISNEKNVPTIGEIKAHITKKRNEALTLFVLNTVAAIVAVLSFVVTGGAAPLAFAVIEVALSVMWIAVEGQHIMHAQDMHKMSQREKALMYLSALFSLVVTITTSVLHVDLIPKVGTIIVGLGLLLVHIYAIYKMEKSEVHS